MDRDAIIDFTSKDHFTQLLLENAIIQHWVNKGEFYIGSFVLLEFSDASHLHVLAIPNSIII